MDEPIVVSGGKKADNRRVKIMAAVGGAIFVLLVVVPKLLGGGGGGGSVTEFPTVGQPTASPVAPAAAVPETFEGFTSKNPFKALIAVDADSGTGVASTGSGGDVGGPVPASPDLSQPPATVPVDSGIVVPLPTDPGPTPTSTPTTVAPRPGARVALLDVYTDPAGKVLSSVRVNDGTFQVGPGDSFADAFKVVSLDVSGRCGDFLFGDEPFRLCVGDEVIK